MTEGEKSLLHSENEAAFKDALGKAKIESVRGVIQWLNYPPYCDWIDNHPKEFKLIVRKIRPLLCQEGRPGVYLKSRLLEALEHSEKFYFLQGSNPRVFLVARQLNY